MSWFTLIVIWLVEDYGALFLFAVGLLGGIAAKWYLRR